MHYELFAVLSIIFCLLVLGGEYLWLAILAKRQEDSKNKYTAASQKIQSMVEGIIYSPTENSRKNETELLKELMGNDTRLFEMISAQLLFGRNTATAKPSAERIWLLTVCMRRLTP